MPCLYHSCNIDWLTYSDYRTNAISHFYLVEAADAPNLGTRQQRVFVLFRIKGHTPHRSLQQVWWHGHTSALIRPPEIYPLLFFVVVISPFKKSNDFVNKCQGIWSLCLPPSSPFGNRFASKEAMFWDLFYLSAKDQIQIQKFCQIEFFSQIFKLKMRGCKESFQKWHEPFL